MNRVKAHADDARWALRMHRQGNHPATDWIEIALDSFYKASEAADAQGLHGLAYRLAERAEAIEGRRA